MAQEKSRFGANATRVGSLQVWVGATENYMVNIGRMLGDLSLTSAAETSDITYINAAKGKIVSAGDQVVLKGEMTEIVPNILTLISGGGLDLTDVATPSPETVEEHVFYDATLGGGRIYLKNKNGANTAVTVSTVSTGAGGTGTTHTVTTDYTVGAVTDTADEYFGATYIAPVGGAGISDGDELYIAYTFTRAAHSSLTIPNSSYVPTPFWVYANNENFDGANHKRFEFTMSEVYNGEPIVNFTFTSDNSAGEDAIMRIPFSFEGKLKYINDPYRLAYALFN